MRLRPTSFASSFTPVPTGSSGRCAGLMPKGSAWRVMQFDTLRLRLIKIAARVVELKKQIKIHLPSSTPDQAVFGIVLNRLPRLVTLKTGHGAPPPHSCPSTPSAYPLQTKQTRRGGNDTPCRPRSATTKKRTAMIYAMPMYFAPA